MVAVHEATGSIPVAGTIFLSLLLLEIREDKKMFFDSIKNILPSGLRVIYVPIKSSNVITTLILYGVGSRNEDSEIAGISHVLEHMFFKGSEKRPTSQLLAEFIESIGGEHNAFTGKEYTGYYTKVSSKNLEKSFDFLSDLIANPVLDPKELEKEKQVILQELSMYQDLPSDVAANKFESLVFGNNSLGREIIGTKESIRKINRDDLLNHKNSYYQASNAILVIAGNYSRYQKRLDEMVKKYFSSLGLGKSMPTTKINFPKPERIGIISKPVSQSHLCVGFRAPSVVDEDRYPMKVLSVILGDSMSSRMFVEIREKRNLAYVIRTSYSGYCESGAIETQAGIAINSELEAIKAIMAEYNRIKMEPVHEDELNRAKEIISGKMLIALEDSEQVAHFFAVNELQRRDDLTPSELLLKYGQVTMDDIMRVAKKYLTIDNLSIAVVTPTELKETDILELL